MKKIALVVGFVSLSILSSGCSSSDEPPAVDPAKVTLEVIAFDLAPGTDEAAFRAADKPVEELVKQQPGFLRRVTGFGRHEAQGPTDPEKRQFYITVYWETLADANAAAEALLNSDVGKAPRPGATIAHYGHYVIGDSAAAGGYEVPADDVLAADGAAIEVVSFDVKDGADPADVIEQDVGQDVGFLREQPGYMARVGAMGKNELTQSTAHVAVVYWSSLDAAVNAANALFTMQSMSDPSQTPSYQKPGTPYFYSHYYEGLELAK